MLERTSRFVLEVLPYLLTALIVAVLVPGALYSHAHSTKALVMSHTAYRENIVEISGDHATLEDRALSDSRP